jgi:hypothetical protein
MTARMWSVALVDSQRTSTTKCAAYLKECPLMSYPPVQPVAAQ